MMFENGIIKKAEDPMNMKFRRVTLRPIEAEDLPMLQKMYNEPEVNQDTMGWDFPVSMDHQVNWYSSIKHDRSTLRFMIQANTGETVGMISVSDIDTRNRTANVNGAKVLSEYQNKGYAYEAAVALFDALFDQMDFYCIQVMHLESQTVTKHLCEKFNFSHEGILRNRIFKNGARHSVWVWSIAHDEYKKVRAAI